MKRFLCLVLAMLLLTAAGCSPSEPVEATDNTIWVTYEVFSGTVVGDTNALLLEYGYRHPVLSAGAAVKVINTKLDNATTAYLYGSGGVQELTELARSNGGKSWFVPYELHRRVAVTRADATVIGFRYSDYSFTGGLVGSTTETVVTYDAATGQQLSFADLSDDADGLRAYCHACLLELLESEVYAEAGFLPNYTVHLDTVLNNWALTAEGLEFIANPYILTSNDSGVMRFTIPYKDLEGMVHEKWLPEPHSGSGSLSLGLTGSDKEFALVREGERVVIRISGTVYDFSAERVETVAVRDTAEARLTEQYLYSPEITDKSIALTIPTVGSTPDTLIRCRSGDGTEHQFYIAKTDKGWELIPPDELLPRA